MSIILDSIRGVVQLVLFALAATLTVAAIRSGVWNGTALLALITSLALVATMRPRKADR